MQLEHGGLSMLLQPSNANPQPLRACSRSSPQVCSKQPTSNWGQRLPSCHMHALHAVFCLLYANDVLTSEYRHQGIITQKRRLAEMIVQGCSRAGKEGQDQCSWEEQLPHWCVDGGWPVIFRFSTCN